MLYELIPGGTIACKNGRAMVAPKPLNILLREICHVLIVLSVYTLVASHYKFFSFIIHLVSERFQPHQLNDEFLRFKVIVF